MKKTTSTLLFAILLGCGVALTGCSSSDSAADQTPDVKKGSFIQTEDIPLAPGDKQEQYQGQEQEQKQSQSQQAPKQTQTQKQTVPQK